jgi:peroxiredoxin
MPSSLLARIESQNKYNIMVATKSNMLPIGTTAPNFQLKDVTTGEVIEFAKQNNAKGYVIAFICNHCPFVIHLLDHLSLKFNQMPSNGIEVYAISSNDIQNYPQDSPEKMAQLATQHKFTFPYLFDGNQEVAISYRAACTPDFFLFDDQKKLFYRGQYDSTRPGSKEVISGEDLLGAINNLLKGKTSPVDQQPSIGCNIKWIPGREPEYFNA